MSTTNINPYQYMGNDVSNLTDIDDMLASGGAGFDVKLVPVTGDLDGTSITDEAHRMVVRTDTNESLAIHKRGYTVVQYRDLLQSAADAMKVGASNATIQTVGTIDNGKQFYASILIDSFALDPGGVNDQIDTYLALLGSHDGTIGVTYAYTSYRIECSNQNPIVSKEPMSLKLKHTKTVADRIDLGIRAFALAPAVQIELQRICLSLQARPSSTDKVVKTFERFYGKPSDADEGKGRTRLQNKLDRIVALYEGDTCVGSVGETRWAEYNAFTEYLDHHRLQGGKDPVASMATTTILPGTWVDRDKRNIQEFLLAA